MTGPALQLSQIKQAIAEGRSGEFYHQRVQLEDSADCSLNCGVPRTLTLEATFVGSWPNHDNSGVVLDLREVSFRTLSGTHVRGEAFAYVRTEPPTPKPSDD
jgi:hypothetical protein